MAKLPDTLGPYRRTRLVRSGKSNAIWQAIKAEDGDAGGHYVLKILAREHWNSKEKVRQLQHEYQVAHALSHPGIIRVHEFSMAGEIPFLVLEQFEGTSVKQVMRKGGHDGILANIVTIVEQAGAAIQHLNQNGWVHCDVKPDNLLINDDAELKLIDFAVARRVAKSRQALFFGKHRQVCGTLNYMSPEQVRGAPLDVRSDIYSFGCLVFELLTGKVPYTGNSVNEVLNKHLKAPIPSVLVHCKKAPPELADVIRRMMSKQPGQRPSTMLHVMAELRTLLDGIAAEQLNLNGKGGLDLASVIDSEFASSSCSAARTLRQLEGEDGESPTIAEDRVDGPLTSSAEVGGGTHSSVVIQLKGKQDEKKKVPHLLRGALFATVARLLQSRGIQVSLAVSIVGLIAGIVVFRQLPPSEKLVHAQFHDLSQQIQLCRQNDASETDWSTLRTRVETIIADSSNLLRRANSSRPGLLELAWAANLLPEAVREGRSGRSGDLPSAEKLAMHLDNAKQHSTRRSEIKSENATESSDISDVLFWVFIGVDVVLVSWLVVFVIRARRRRAVVGHASR